ncbi:4-carboxymuconolactone decarboxylase [Rhodococcus sp. WB1]|jgi:AhpD family alkylhydroperoxidase|uniref:carboxymuconolactone decarboxylase family protein n=1 Tax=Rhodococcus TaxID=1827 RepID=UPI00081A93C0|nr:MULTISPECIES: carboxymuconolactone decarboxylase family protein [Rhodococcus]ANZ24101.1 4-carboxymuconolactone decarboxylase [Rhodococcus sp. WB1]PND53518.1 carboxymuconolactone decarboxylase family protein [Rhodococcus sp. ENV425]WFS15512.1 carboxymuconolactone decarboxylase family protein [Rhodococcus aetherivorans]WKW97401.1 carboxymuconolactone decarboxylase family protein [Rhodococcus aetherivorans]
MSPRIRPGRFRELGPLNWAAWRVLSTVAGTKDAHLFSTLGRTGGLFRGWLHYSGKLMPFGRLPRFESELVILRVAHLRECGYELDHHTRLGRRAGITPEILQRILDGPGAPGWSPRHRAMLAAVDELVTTRDLADGTWKALAAHLDDRRMVEFCLLVAQYDGLATTIGVLRIERDF